MPEYIPGVCNIGPAEIAKRKQAGWFGVVMSVITLLILLLLHASPIYRLLIFFPVSIAAVGFLQAYFHFCANFGMRGLYNVLRPAGQTETITQKEFRKADRLKSLKIIGLSILIGIAVSLFLSLLPIS